MMHDFYRPQTKLPKGNVFTSMCQKFCPGGECMCVAGGMHGREGVHGRGMCGVGGGMHGRREHVCWEGGVCVAGDGRACVAGETATTVDVTHPTGIHSYNQRSRSVFEDGGSK